VTILAIDLGTSAVKAAVFDTELIALGRADVVTATPHPGWAEQDPEDWWRAACAALQGLPLDDVEVISFATQRETFTLLDADGTPLCPALLWSDRRAEAEAVEVANAAGGIDAIRERTGVIVDAGSTAAKLRWLATHCPDVVARAHAVVGPRDFIVHRLIGVIGCDRSVASRTGLFARDGSPDDAMVSAARIAPSLLAVPVASTTVVGAVREHVAHATGLGSGTPVVIGAGDRACEVLGTGASPTCPMVSWGTTVNVSRPLASGAQVPAGMSHSVGAQAETLVEAGLSAAGAAMAWLSSLTGQSVPDLAAAALGSQVGARGLIALPWWHGARAPWWQPGVRAAFLGLAPAHTAGDLARAVYEGVAHDVRRCLAGLAATSLVGAGGGAQDATWRAVLPAVSGLPVAYRRCPEAAALGAALLGAAALGTPFDLDTISPVTDVDQPSPEDLDRYAELAAAHDDAARRVLG
jgi:xylulokinase